MFYSTVVNLYYEFLLNAELQIVMMGDNHLNFQ